MISDVRRFYISAGTLPRNAPSYVVRAADEALYSALHSGEFCYVLTSRQMGKSSLMVRTVDRLQAAGASVAVLDLTRLGNNLTVEQWYNGLIEQLGERLGLREEAEAFARENEHLSPLQRWLGALSRVALRQIRGQIIIFVDEIDVVRSLPFSADEFFSAIRACHNARANEAAFQRLTFCLLGVATPSELINNPRLTPFNVGTRIYLHDFSAGEVGRLQDGLRRDVETNRLLMQRVLFWTGGHPCLTQRLCKAVAEDERVQTPASVDCCCRQMFLESRSGPRDDNLEFVRQRLLGDSEQDAAGLLTLYEQVRNGRQVADDETIPVIAQLKLSGAVRVEAGLLAVRNRIYEQVFDRSWVLHNLPGAELRRQKAAFRRGLIRASSIAAAVLAIVISLSIAAIFQAGLAERNAKIARAQTRRAIEFLYAANMGLIGSAYEHNDFRRMRRLLQETRENSDRGFEWGYWDRLCQLDAMTLEGHSGSVFAAAFSPDGRQIATNSEDGTLAVWDAETGRHLLTLRGATCGIDVGRPWPSQQHVEYSSDGRRILAARQTGTVRDTATGRELPHEMGRDSREWVAAYSADWKQILAPRWNQRGAVDIRDAATNKKILTIEIKRPIASAAFSPDGRWVVIGTDDGIPRTCDTVTGHASALFRGHKGTVLALAYSPDGRRIVSAGMDRTARVWDAANARTLLTLKGHDDAVNFACFSRDGRRILTGSEDHTARVWDAVSGRQIAVMRGHEDGICSAAFSWDGRRVVTSSRDGTAKVWNITNVPGPLTFTGHAAAVGSAVCSPSGDRLLTCSDDHTAKVWDAVTSRVLFTLRGHGSAVNSAAFARDGLRIVTASRDRTASVWDAVTGQRLALLKGHVDEVASAVFSPDGSRVVTGSWDRTARVWNTLSGRALWTLKGHTDRIYSVAFSPDGKRILIGSADKTASVWDAADGRLLLTLRGHHDKIYSVAFSPDGRAILTASRDRTARIWNAEDGRALLTIDGPEAPVYSAEFSPDGRRIVTASGRTANLWDATNGRELLALKGHKSTVFSATFSADGRRIATASADGTAKIWNAGAR